MVNAFVIVVSKTTNKTKSKCLCPCLQKVLITYGNNPQNSVFWLTHTWLYPMKQQQHILFFIECASGLPNLFLQLKIMHIFCLDLYSYFNNIYIFVFIKKFIFWNILFKFIYIVFNNLTFIYLLFAIL